MGEFDNEQWFALDEDEWRGLASGDELLVNVGIEVVRLVELCLTHWYGLCLTTYPDLGHSDIATTIAGLAQANGWLVKTLTELIELSTDASEDVWFRLVDDARRLGCDVLDDLKELRTRVDQQTRKLPGSAGGVVDVQLVTTLRDLDAAAHVAACEVDPMLFHRRRTRAPREGVPELVKALQAACAVADTLLRPASDPVHTLHVELIGVLRADATDLGRYAEGIWSVCRRLVPEYTKVLVSPALAQGARKFRLTAADVTAARDSVAGTQGVLARASAVLSAVEHRLPRSTPSRRAGEEARWLWAAREHLASGSPALL
jgi:hypothetical protein